MEKQSKNKQPKPNRTKHDPLGLQPGDLSRQQELDLQGRQSQDELPHNQLNSLSEDKPSDRPGDDPATQLFGQANKESRLQIPQSKRGHK